MNPERKSSLSKRNSPSSRGVVSWVVRNSQYIYLPKQRYGSLVDTISNWSPLTRTHRKPQGGAIFPTFEHFRWVGYHKPDLSNGHNFAEYVSIKKPAPDFARPLSSFTFNGFSPRLALAAEGDVNYCLMFVFLSGFPPNHAESHAPRYENGSLWGI